MSEHKTLAELLAEHEARWTTHGFTQTYDVMHCAGQDCGWRLRQKALMSDEDCYDLHRLHQQEVILAHLASEQAVEAVAKALVQHCWDTYDEVKIDGAWTHVLCCECGEQVPFGAEDEHLARAALAAQREVLGGETA